MNVALQTWLDLQCQVFPGVRRALVALGNSPEQFPEEFAVWPAADATHEDLLAMARAGLAGTGAAAAGDWTNRARCGVFPLPHSGHTLGYFVAEWADNVGEDYPAISQQLEQSSVWLQFARALALNDQTGHLLSLIRLQVACLESGGFGESAMAFVNQLASLYGGAAAALGLVKGSGVRLCAHSGVAHFEADAQPMQAIAAAMQEAIDQGRALSFPPAADDPGRPVLRAHENLAKSGGIANLISIPLQANQRMIGALTLSNPHAPWSAEQRKHLQFAALLAGPILDLKRAQDRGVWVSLRLTAERRSRQLFGPDHLTAKVVAASLALAGLAGLIPVDHHIKADATLEGVVQRMVAAPVDGFIGQSLARPGDTVKANALLGSLDDRDARLELQKWSNQLQQHQSEYREALALHNQAKASILSAQISQAEAQITLLNDKLSKLAITAPFDGVVIDGDLSQSLGAPVTRGDKLFTLAPLDDYRLMLNVDESDFADIRATQTGRLVLAGLPGQTFAFRVEKITPVTTARDGRNFFRVESRLLDDKGMETLRPGMKGVGKIEVGPRRLGWIWTHSWIAWLRLWAWQHLP